MKRALLWAAVIGTGVLACASPGTVTSGKVSSVLRTTIVLPEGRVETAPAASRGDAADDPAVWVHPWEPGASLVSGTGTGEALRVYHLDGPSCGELAEGLEPRSVEVRYGFLLDGKRVDLAIVGLGASAVRGGKV